MEIKPFVILLCTSFGLLVIGAIIGNVLESSGTLTKENLGPKGVAAVMAFFFGLFCLMAFPLFRW